MAHEGCDKFKCGTSRSGKDNAKWKLDNANTTGSDRANGVAVSHVWLLLPLLSDCSHSGETFSNASQMHLICALVLERRLIVLLGADAPHKLVHAVAAVAQAARVKTKVPKRRNSKVSIEWTLLLPFLGNNLP